MEKRFLTRNHGRAISITKDAGLSAKIGKAVTQWKEWKAFQPQQRGFQGGKGKKPNKGANKGGAQGAADGNSLTVSLDSRPMWF